MTHELALGPSVVMEISGCGEKTAKAFRELVGPMDPVRSIFLSCYSTHVILYHGSGGRE